jgi:TLC domain
LFSQHHFVAIAYLSGPVLWPEYRWFMGACLTVEINTWFLILRRVLFKRKAPALLQKVVEIGFYVSWIAIRVILYPLIMYMFCGMALERIQETGYLFHWPMIFIPVHFFLCVLNLVWTYDLFLPFFKKSSSEPPQIASGL